MTAPKPPQQCFRRKTPKLLRSTPDKPGIWKKLFSRLYRAGHGFWSDDCTDRAGLLAYTTLFGLIPLVVLIFSLWNLIGFSLLHRAQVDQLILRSFIPQTGYTILNKINMLAERGGQLSWFGILGLGITAIFLLHAVERHFNAIWGVTPHCLGCRVLRYLLMLVVGPLAITLILPLMGPVQPLWAYLGHIPVMPSFLEPLLAFLIVTVMMTLLYKILPAATTRWRDVFLGGITTALLFEISKIGLAGYLRFSTFETLYGALGAFPIFLLWLYIAWASILFGAEMAAADREHTA